MSDTNIPPPPLHTQNPLGRFSDRADDYAKYRPSYPPAAVDCVLEGLAPPETLIAADIGAGTGISSRLLAERGVTVRAIEPNAAMRAAALPHPQIEFLPGTAEQTGLAEGSMDLVICCQSFHWFNPLLALPEFHRILKPGGRVAVMWNNRDLDDEFTRRYSTLVEAASDRSVLDHDDRKSAHPLGDSPLFTGYRQFSFTHSQTLTPVGLLGLALSASYVPKSGTACEQLRADLQCLCDEWSLHASTIALVYRTNVFLAEAM
ncbi:MAG: class I SAM-dependent methyltransferase [Synechococcales cyanobacterium C42_A2020_086]|jgi:SAM-dependent methyltransferase|nr:class I SAM-dependent methyltransferase [Synechococcales cyanobacterium C42_A2020_086]